MGAMVWDMGFTLSVSGKREMSGYRSTGFPKILAGVGMKVSQI